jgi:hypothetical protein
METPAFHAPLHGAMGVAKPSKLPDRNDTMLPPSQRRQFMPPP